MADLHDDPKCINMHFWMDFLLFFPNQFQQISVTGASSEDFWLRDLAWQATGPALRCDWLLAQDQ